jgi:hypothetical protein
VDASLAWHGLFDVVMIVAGWKCEAWTDHASLDLRAGNGRAPIDA